MIKFVHSTKEMYTVVLYILTGNLENRNVAK